MELQRQMLLLVDFAFLNQSSFFPTLQKSDLNNLNDLNDL